MHVANVEIFGHQAIFPRTRLFMCLVSIAGREAGADPGIDIGTEIAEKVETNDPRLKPGE